MLYFAFTHITLYFDIQIQLADPHWVGFLCVLCTDSYPYFPLRHIMYISVFSNHTNITNP